VVKVIDRKPAVVAAELNSLVVTQPWERFIHRAHGCLCGRRRPR
jgi:hypothetical protein